MNTELDWVGFFLSRTLDKQMYAVYVGCVCMDVGGLLWVSLSRRWHRKDATHEQYKQSLQAGASLWRQILLCTIAEVHAAINSWDICLYKFSTKSLTNDRPINILLIRCRMYDVWKPYEIFSHLGAPMATFSAMSKFFKFPNKTFASFKLGGGGDVDTLKLKKKTY